MNRTTPIEQEATVSSREAPVGQDPVEGTIPPSLGKVLSSTRRRRHISIDRVARDTYIPATHLRRLESDDLTFSSPVYVRAFLKEYVVYLRIDPEKVATTLESLVDEDEASLLAEAERSFDQRPLTGRRAARNLAIISAVLWATSMAVVAIISEEPRPRSAPGPVPQTADVAVSGEDAAKREPAISKAPNRTTAGVRLEVTASTARCWIEVVVDGRAVFSDVLEVGQRRIFKADKRMFVLLGFPAGVEMTVNGKHVRSLARAEPIRLALPHDLTRLDRLVDDPLID
jgi:hypothetical protein